MKLKLDEIYSITSDNMNYILQETKESKNKDEEIITYEINKGYYSTISSALIAYKEILIRTSDVSNIEELLKLIKELDKKIISILRGN